MPGKKKTIKVNSSLKNKKLVLKVPTHSCEAKKVKKGEGKKAKLEKKVKKFDKRISAKGVENYTGKSNSTGLKAVADKINNKVALSAVLPARKQEPVNLPAFRRFLAHWIASTIRYKPALVCRLSSGEFVSPKDLWVYGHILLFSLVRKHGTMTGNGTQDLPDFEKMSAPLGLAKLLEYLLPYEREGVLIVPTLDFDMDALVGGDSSLKVGVPGLPSSFNSLEYDVMGNAISSLPDFQVRTPQAFPYSWATWVGARIGAVQARLSDTVGSLAPLDGMKRAPDSSALARKSNGAIQSYHSRHINWDIAQVFASEYSDDAYGLGCLEGSFKAPIAIPIRPSAANSIWSYEDQICAAFMWICFNADAWVPGHVLRLRVKRQKIRTLAPTYKRAYGVTFNQLLCSTYKAMTELNPNFSDNSVATPTTSGPQAKLFIADLAVQMLWCRRMQDHCPIDVLAAPLTGGTYFPQAFTNIGLPGLLLPPAIAKFINSVGAAVIDGAVCYPCPATDGTQPLASYEIMRGSAEGLAWKTTDSQKFPFSFQTWTQAPPEAIIGEMQFNAAQQAVLTAQYTSNNGMSLFPYLGVQSIIGSVNEMYATFGDISGNMVEYVSCPWGCVSQMATMGTARESFIVTLTNGSVSRARPNKGKVGITIPFQISAIVLCPTDLVSAVPINAAEVIEGLTYAADAAAGLPTIGPNSFQSANNNIAATFLTETLSQTFTPNLLDPGTDVEGPAIVHTDGVTMMTKTVVEQTKGSKTYDSLVCVAAQGLVKASPLLCYGADIASGYLPVVGPWLVGNVQPLCEYGIAKIADYVVQRCEVVSEETQKPKSNLASDYGDDSAIIAKIADLTKNEKSQFMKAMYQMFSLYMAARKTT